MTSDADVLVTLLQAQIDGDVLLVNSGKSKAAFTVVSCSGAESVAEDRLVNQYLNTERRDVVFVVSWIRDEASRVRGNVPRSVDGYFSIKVMSMDKLGVDGNNLRDLAMGELRRIFGGSDVGFRWFGAGPSADHKLKTAKIFSSVFTVVKLTES